MQSFSENNRNKKTIEPPQDAKTNNLEIYSSSGLVKWLEHINASIAFTTYQAGRLFFLGRKNDSQLWIHERMFEHCQGLCINGRNIWASSLYQLWKLTNIQPEGQTMENGCDANFVPRNSHITGNIDIHDIATDKKGNPVFVNTKFNCLATISNEHNFKVLWKPDFISQIIAEDRCHLNGMAMKNGKPKYVTAISRSDTFDGWRDRRTDGGIVIDVETNKVITTGLSMPHSPRLYKNKLWLLNSGTGYFGYIDPQYGTFNEVCFCPGYARGLAFIENYAVIGLSLPRVKKTFDGLTLDKNLKEKDSAPRCGLIIVDIKKAQVIEWLRIEGNITELYDVQMLPGIKQPRAVSLYKKEEICNISTF